MSAHRRVLSARVKTSAAVVATGIGATIAAGVLATPAAASADPWAAIRQCESGGNYSINTGNGFYGAYQFTLQTWRGLGMKGLPSQAAAAVQDQAARRLAAQYGMRPWPVCGHRYGGPAPSGGGGVHHVHPHVAATSSAVRLPSRLAWATSSHRTPTWHTAAAGYHADPSRQPHWSHQSYPSDEHYRGDQTYRSDTRAAEPPEVRVGNRDRRGGGRAQHSAGRADPRGRAALPARPRSRGLPPRGRRTVRPAHQAGHDALPGHPPAGRGRARRPAHQVRAAAGPRRAALTRGGGSRAGPPPTGRLRAAGVGNTVGSACRLIAARNGLRSLPGQPALRNDPPICVGCRDRACQALANAELSAPPNHTLAVMP